MKKLLLLLLILFSIQTITAYDKKSIIERFTNAACGPTNNCAGGICFSVFCLFMQSSYCLLKTA